MGSAKTALLLTQAYNFEERNMTYSCLKPIIDTREKDNVIRANADGSIPTPTSTFSPRRCLRKR